MTEEYRQTLAVACPVHPENARIRRVSVVYEEMSHRLLSPVPVLRAATRLAWAGTACGVLGMAAIWIGNLIDLCDGVFFQPGTLCQAPVARVVEGIVNDGDVISPAAFHRLVWKAGGYGGPPGRLAG